MSYFHILSNQHDAANGYIRASHSRVLLQNTACTATAPVLAPDKSQRGQRGGPNPAGLSVDGRRQLRRGRHRRAALGDA